MCKPVLDCVEADAFAERLLDVFNNGALTLMISVGHRVGLFDRMAQLPAATSLEIAEAAELNERYVREWLAAMVVGRIVDHDPIGQTYWLPQERAAFLTRAAAPDNMAVFAQYIPLLAGVEDQIIDCFRRGGGVPYSAYPRFHEVMAADSGQTVVSALFDSILPLVPGLGDRLQEGVRVLDVGCGRGRALNQLAAAYPASQFTGVDLSADAIGEARADAATLGNQNIQFEVRDAASVTGCFDLVTAFDAIHDQARPAAVLAAIASLLPENGVFLMQDIRASSHVHENLDHPAAPLLYTISCMHCMTVSLAAGGAGLGAMWGEQCALEMLAAAGFSQVQVEQLPHDFQNSYYVARR
ncbi:MAG: class I SAM-dependent methyltransferase [Planctomycetota bacterium]